MKSARLVADRRREGRGAAGALGRRTLVGALVVLEARSPAAARGPRRCGPRAGTPSTAVGPKRESTSGEITTGSSRPPGATSDAAGVEQRDRLRLAGAALPAARAESLELLGHVVTRGPRLDGGVARAEQHETRLPERVGVGREQRQRVARRRRRSSSSTPSTRPEHVLLGGQRHLVPDAALLELPQAGVVLGHVGADAEVPLRQPDQLHRLVTPPARPSRLDLDRGQRRLAVLAPVHGPRAAVDQARPRAAPGTATATSGTSPGRSS